MSKMQLTSHSVNPANEKITVEVLDDQGSGGAHHHYRITINRGEPGQNIWDITFQNGPIKEAGVNGLTHEALLAILRHRLECFQQGPFRCDDNAVALSHIVAAQESLLNRTRARMARGVEGTHKI